MKSASFCKHLCRGILKTCHVSYLYRSLCPSATSLCNKDELKTNKKEISGRLFESEANLKTVHVDALLVSF